MEKNKMVETNKKNDKLNRLLTWFQNDKVFIIISLLVLGACYYTIESIDKYQEQINNAWMLQWNESCTCQQKFKPQPVNITFKLGGNYNAT